MRAARVHTPGPPEVIRIEDVDEPVPATGEVLVQVVAAGVNLLDTLHRSGRSPRPMPMGLGVEGAGTIIAVGDGVDVAQLGRRVAWHSTPGSYAELVAIDLTEATPLPPGVDEATAAAVLHQGITAHYLTTVTSSPGPSDTVLVHAAGGGVGHLVVQLVNARGARVIAATSTSPKAERARDLGADAVVRYGGDLAAEVRRLTGGRGVDVVYDPLGQLSFQASLDCLRTRGLLVAYGATTGPVPAFDPQLLAEKGSLFVTRPVLRDHTADPTEEAWRAGELLGLVAAGRLRVHVHGRYPLEAAARAHADLESGTTSGKLLLLP